MWNKTIYICLNCTLQLFLRKNEDNHSETSGETNDSGRGGSESDIHSNALNQSSELGR